MQQFIDRCVAIELANSGRLPALSSTSHVALPSAYKLWTSNMSPVL